MAEEITELGLDASGVIEAIVRLQGAFNKYTDTLQKNIKTSQQFNSVEANTTAVIDRTAASMDKAAVASARLAKSFLAPGGLRDRATLNEIKAVNDAMGALDRVLGETETDAQGLQTVLSNLTGDFEGDLARVQSGVIRLKGALDGLGKTNVTKTAGVLKQQAALLDAEINQQVKQAGRLLDAQNKAKLSAERAEIGRTGAGAVAARFSTAGVDPAKVAGFNIAVQRLQQVIEKSGISSERFFQILESGNTIFTGAEGRVKAAIDQVNRLGQTLSNTSEKTTAFRFNLQSLLNIFTFQVALSGLSQVINLFTQAVPAARQFEKSVAQVSTITEEGSRNIDLLARSTTALANEFGRTNAEVAAGFYQAVSNQVGTTTETLQFLTTALKFSVAAVTDLSSSVDTLSGVQNAYNQTSAQAAENADILFRVIDLGRVTADELGESFGRITPLAAQLGVSLKEVGAAIAAATQQGVTFRDAQTQLLNLLVEAIKPTGAFKDRMNELGFATADAGIAARGFAGFFSAIAEGAKDSEELAKLFNNVRGLRGQISIFARDGELLKNALREIEDSAGATQRAFEQIRFTDAVKVEAEINRVKNALETGFGRTVNQILASAIDTFGGLTNATIVLAGTITTLVSSAVILTLTNQVQQLAFAIGGANAAAIAGTAGIVGLGLAVGAFVGSLVNLAIADTRIEDISAKFEDLRRTVAEEAARTASDTAKAQRPIRDAIDATTARLVEAEEQRSAAYRRALDQALAVEKANSQNLETQLTRRLSAFERFTNAVKKLQDDAAQNQKRLTDNIAATQREVEARRFDRSLEGLDEGKQASALIIRVNRLLEQAKAAVGRGETQVAEQAINDAKAVAFRFEDLTGNATLVNKLLREQRTIYGDIGNLQRRQVAEAERVEAANRPILEQARQQIALAQELLKKRDAAIKEGASGQGTVDAINKQLAGVLKRVDSLGGQLNLGKLLATDLKGTDIQNAVDDLRRVVADKPLELQLQTNIDEFKASLQKAIDSSPIRIRLAFEDPSINRSKSFIDLKKQAERGLDVAANQTKSLKEAILAQDEFREKSQAFARDVGDAVFNQTGSFERAEAAERRVTETAERIIEFLANSRNFDEQTGQLTAKAAAVLEEQSNRLREVAKFANSEAGNDALSAERALLESRQRLLEQQKEIDSGEAAQQQQRLLETQRELENALPIDADKVNQEIDAIKPVTLKVDDSGISQATSTLVSASQEVANSVQTAANSIVSVSATQVAAVNTVVAAEDQIGIEAISASAEANAALSTIGPTALSQVPGVRALAAALRELAAARAASGGFAANGALIQRFATGGQARGSDTVSAMLTPGEVVVNPKGSRKFFSQLMAINAGANPVFRNTGGQVGDSFGDVTINIDNRDSGQKLDGRAIYRQLQREARRGTIGK